MLFLMLFILLLNIVAIVLTYYCLEDADKKDKVIFIAIGIAVMYMLTSLIYWISSRGIEVKEISETGKNLLTFLFVPINGILVLPILAKSYRRYKTGRINGNHLRNRAILLGILLLIVLIVECIYFKDIQNGVINMLNEKKQEEQLTTDAVMNQNPNMVQNQVTNENTNQMTSKGVSAGNSISVQENTTNAGNVVENKISNSGTNRIEANTNKID